MPERGIHDYLHVVEAVAGHNSYGGLVEETSNDDLA